MKTNFHLIVAFLSLSWVAAAEETNRYPIIDIHTHVFNAKYLPVQGIVESHHVPKLVASGLKKIIVGGTRVADFSTKAEESNRRRLSGLALMDDKLLMGALGLDANEDIGKELLRNSGVAGLTAEEAEAAHQMGVSARTLSLWECDRVYPTWPQQAVLVEFLGYDPFTNPALGAPGGNESPSVASLSPDKPISLGRQIKVRRLELRKTRQQ